MGLLELLIHFWFGVRPGNTSLTGILGDSDHQAGLGNTTNSISTKRWGLKVLGMQE